MGHAAEADFLELAAGKLNPQQAFMKGKLKLKGNMAIAMKLNAVLDAARKAGVSIPSASTGAAAASAPAAPAAAAAKPAAKPAAAAGGTKTAPVFEAIRFAIEEDGASLVKKVGGVIQFNITGAGAPVSYALDLKNGKGSLANGEAKSPDLTLTVSDDDFFAMSTGSLNPQQAFMKGKLKIKGCVPRWLHRTGDASDC